MKTKLDAQLIQVVITTSLKKGAGGHVRLLALKLFELIDFVRFLMNFFLIHFAREEQINLPTRPLATPRHLIP